MPAYDCGDPECAECQRAFGPDRAKAIANYKFREAQYAALACEPASILSDPNVRDVFKDGVKDAPSNPRVSDNDRDEITVTLDGKELRGWSYSSEQERRTKMRAAREYVEGYCNGRDAR